MVQIPPLTVDTGSSRKEGDTTSIPPSRQDRSLLQVTLFRPMRTMRILFIRIAMFAPLQLAAQIQHDVTNLIHVNKACTILVHDSEGLCPSSIGMDSGVVCRNEGQA